MKTLVLIPSPMEFRYLTDGAEPERLGRHRVVRGHGSVWALCGIGSAAAALSTSALVSIEKPDRVLLAGIAGAFRKSSWEPGRIAQIRNDCFADLGFCQNGKFVTLDQMSLPVLPLEGESIGCRFPFYVLDQQEPAAVSVTVSCITSDEERAMALRRDFDADIENMEGAGVALACAFHGLPCGQVRAVSNWVGPRDPSNWLIKEPLARLRTWILERI